MSEVFHFTPRHELTAQENLATFIRLCKDELTVFGSKLDWDSDYWPSAGVAFGNLDQKTSKLDKEKAMRGPFIEFAKSYFRYQQGHRPSASRPEMRALKCLERALLSGHVVPNIQNISAGYLDHAASLARENYSPGMAYAAGRELARLAKFVSDKGIVSTRLDWKNPISRPIDTVRTGKQAKDQREKKLPSDDVLDAIADIFAGSPIESRDIFTTCVSAMLLCAPSRITEVLALPVDCEVWETKRDGKKAYGWRFQPGKGGAPMIKWIPDAMVNVAQEAISRVRYMTEEARRIASWYENHPDKFYEHVSCPDVAENQPLTVLQTAQAIGIQSEKLSEVKTTLQRYGLSDGDGANTLASLARWARARLPREFPWYDQERGIRYSDALFCLRERQLRTDMSASVFMVWKPTNNVFNNDLESRETMPGYFVPSIFDRHGFNKGREKSLKATSHQFRHLLNTIAQRGGLSQAEISRWSGRVDMKQNRVYDHMSEFELVDMIRTHDTALSLDQPLRDIAEQISKRIPMTRQEFNTLVMPTAHVTEYGFCIHDYVMSPCQRFRDCLNCSEQVCIKGDRRLERIRARHAQVKLLKERAEQEISEGSAGADRWYEIHALTETRLAELIEILESPSIEDGTVIRLRNEFEFSPWRRAVAGKAAAGLISKREQSLLEGMRGLLEAGNG